MLCWRCKWFKTSVVFNLKQIPDWSEILAATFGKRCHNIQHTFWTFWNQHEPAQRFPGMLSLSALRFSLWRTIERPEPVMFELQRYRPVSTIPQLTYPDFSLIIPCSCMFGGYWPQFISLEPNYLHYFTFTFEYLDIGPKPKCILSQLLLWSSVRRCFSWNICSKLLPRLRILHPCVSNGSVVSCGLWYFQVAPLPLVLHCQCTARHAGKEEEAFGVWTS